MTRILTKLFLFTLGFIFIIGGSYFVAAGYAHSDPDRVYTAKIPLPHSKTLAQFARKHIVHAPESLRDHMRIDDHGLLVPMAAVGSLLALIGLILILNSLFRFKLDPNESLKSKKESNHISSDFIRSINPDASDEVAPPVATARAGETISFDESMLDVEEDPFEALRDVSNLVTMSQAYIEPRDSERIISMFRSDLLPYVHVVMDDQSMNRLAHQILESVIFRHKRQQEDITADQFQQQDKRVYESESETFLRRYMPVAEKIRSAEMQECAGKTYDLVAQATVQKRFLSETEDWEDISLRNAVEILAKESPQNYLFSSDPE